MDNGEILATFYQECDDQLQVLEDGLSEIEQSGNDPETINAVFRAVHSIKGGAASLSLPRLAHFAHIFENALSSIRSGKVAATDENVPLFFHAMDILSDLVKEARGEGEPVGEDEIEACKKSLTEVSGDSPEGEKEEKTALPAGFQPLPVQFDFGDDDDEEEESSSSEDGGGNKAVGDVKTDNSSAPAAPSSGEEKAPAPKAAPSAPEVSKDDEEKVRQSIDKVLGSKAAKPVDAIKAVGVPAAQAAVKKKPKRQGSETIRVQLGKIDKLMNLVGELVIAQSSLENNASEQRSVSHMESLIRDLQEAVMSIRAQPIGMVFQRMKRVVREASTSTGKKVALELVGEDTEIDRTLVEHLVDPLTHILRNAVDHGIESADVREREGKDPEGHIVLAAEQKSGRIVISVSDDGGGINREKVKQIGIEKGLVKEGAPLSEEDIDNLICAPGFSTNDEVTDLSGRGVGMDVVRSAIQSLGGKMVIKSEPQKGTRFDLSLPLTLAVMDGMLIRVGEMILVVPISMISGIVQIDDTIKSVTTPDGSRIAHVRDRTLPVINMAQALGFPSSGKEDCLLLTEDESGSGAAFEVDNIIDQKQVVIKSLEKNYHKVTGVSGATILGDGSVSLIIDPGALVNG